METSSPTPAPTLSLPPFLLLNWFCINLSGQPGCSPPALLSGKCWDKRIMSLWREAAANGDVSQVTSGNKPSMRGREAPFQAEKLTLILHTSTALHWIFVHGDLYETAKCFYSLNSKLKWQKDTYNRNALLLFLFIFTLIIIIIIVSSSSSGGGSGSSCSSSDIKYVLVSYLILLRLINWIMQRLFFSISHRWTWHTGPWKAISRFNELILVLYSRQ